MKLATMGESAKALLYAFVTELTSLGVDVPDAYYVAPGEIPWDGESLVLSLSDISTGQPGQPIGSSIQTVDAIETTVTLAVELIRPTATEGYLGGPLGLPSIEAMENDGVNALNDAGALYQAAINIKGKGQIVSRGAGFVIGQCVPIGPNGGLAAMRLELALSVDGS